MTHLPPDLTGGKARWMAVTGWSAPLLSCELLVDAVETLILFQVFQQQRQINRTKEIPGNGGVLQGNKQS